MSLLLFDTKPMQVNVYRWCSAQIFILNKPRKYHLTQPVCFYSATYEKAVRKQPVTENYTNTINHLLLYWFGDESISELFN